MQQTNRQGIVIYDADGNMVENSFFSARSLERIVRHSELFPVPDIEGVFYRLAPGEDTQLSDAQRQTIHERARMWQQHRATQAAEKPDKKTGKKDGAKANPAQQPDKTPEKVD